MDEPYHIGFVSDSPPDARDLYNRCRRAGLKTTRDGQDEVVTKYRIGLAAHTDTSLDDALEAVEDAENSSMHFWTDSDMMLRVGVSNPTTEDEQMVGCVSISFQTSEIGDDTQQDSTHETRVTEVLDIVENLVPAVDPEYVWSSVYKGHVDQNQFIPGGRPIADNIGHLSWLTVIADEIMDQFGGRERILATPAFRVQEFDSGHIMIVLEAHPLDVTELTHSSAREHLLRQ